VNTAISAVLTLVLMTAGTEPTVQRANPSVSSLSRPSNAAAEIGKFMQELYRRGQFNGAVLVADRQGIVYRGGFGVANRASNTAFTPDTPSCLASLSKPLTALAVMMLAKDGFIKYDNHISEYIPELRAGVLDALGPHATPIFLIQSGGLWHSAGCALCITSELSVREWQPIISEERVILADFVKRRRA